MNIKTIMIGLFVLFVGMTGYWYFTKVNIQQDSNQLIVGTAAGYAPWVSINPKGEYEGFDIDFANALSKQMGKKLILKDLGSMTSLFTALEQGKIDAIIWGMSITQDRLKKVAMVNYQGELITSYPLIFWKAIPAGITSISDMNGKTVCVEPTSHQEDVLCKYYGSINRLSTEKVDDALLNIQYGKADGALVEPAIAQKFKNKFPEIQILDVPLDPADQVAGVGVVVKQNNVEMIQEITKAVAQLKTTDIIAQLEQKWNLVS
jgi:ABC-type amino acid transport substrate-binding protein